MQYVFYAPSVDEDVTIIFKLRTYSFVSGSFYYDEPVYYRIEDKITHSPPAEVSNISYSKNVYNEIQFY
jgi:hypothetical protein